MQGSTPQEVKSQDLLDRPTYIYSNSHTISSVNREFVYCYSFWPEVEPLLHLRRICRELELLPSP